MDKPSLVYLRKFELFEALSARFPFVRFLRNQPLCAFEVLGDLRRFRRDIPAIETHSRGSAKKKVLIVSLTPFIYQIKLEGVLAAALRIQGCKVFALCWRNLFWPEKYFKLFGVDSFVYFDNYINKYHSYDPKKEMNDFLAGDLSFQKVKAWRFRHSRLGQQILSKMARRMYGTPSLTDSDIYPVFVNYLRRQVQAIYAAEECLDGLKPDIVIFNEANDSVYGAFFDIAFSRGMQTIQFVHALRDNALVVKRFTPEAKGMHPNSLSWSTFEMIKREPWDSHKEERLMSDFLHRYEGKDFLTSRIMSGTHRKTKEEIIKALGLAPSKKIAVVFSHVLWDANLFYGEDLFEDYEEWFIETVRAACKNPAVNWIIKLHPANVWKRAREGVTGMLREEYLIERHIGSLPGHVFLLYPDTDINTYSLFEHADYGVTVRGTIGMEFPCFGKPVFTAGTGRYSGFGFTVDASSQEHYRQILSRIQEYPALTPEQVLLAKKHAYAVFCRRPWYMKSFRSVFMKRKKMHPLDHNLECCIHSREELSGAPDLREFSSWVLEGTESDYLNQAP